MDVRVNVGADCELQAGAPEAAAVLLGCFRQSLKASWSERDDCCTRGVVVVTSDFFIMGVWMYHERKDRFPDAT